MTAPAGQTLVVGIDTSLRGTGVGVVEGDGVRHRAVHYEVLRNPASWSRSRCLQRIRKDLAVVLEQHRPAVAAIEGAFYCKNAKVALALGEARGAALCACADAGIEVYEYAPRSVKKGIVGRGAASKEQVAHMIKAMLGLDETPPSDAADALAIALCHLAQTRHGLQELKPV